MNKDDYWKSSYDMTIANNSDSISLKKSENISFAEIEHLVNGNNIGLIYLQNQEMAEGLYHMLGQLLQKS